MQCGEWASPDNLLPNCLFGQCVNNTCVCNAGFRHDLVLGRYYNCGLPEWAPITVFTVGMVTTSLSVLYGLFVLLRRAQRWSRLWYSCLGSVSASFTFFLSLICLWCTPDFSMPWYGAFFTILGSVLSANVAGCVLIGVLAPVAASERLGSIRKYEVFFLYLMPLFMLVCMLFSLGLGYGKDEIALGMAFVFLSVALCAAMALPFLYQFPTKLIHALTRSLGGALVAHSQTRVTRVLAKVKNFRLTACLSAFLAVFCCLLASGVHFSTNTLPLSWVFYFGFVVALSLFHMQVSYLALPAPEEPTTSQRNATNDGSPNNKRDNRLSLMVSSLVHDTTAGNHFSFTMNKGSPSNVTANTKRASVLQTTKEEEL